jgi:hypothetical protein
MAADSVVFVGWNKVYPGKEKEALEAFNSSVGFWMKQVQQGNAESFEPVLLERHGGDLNGFFLVRGNATKLNAILQTEEWRDLITRADLYVDGIGVITGFAGEGVMREMARWTKLIS